jgi:uncharacterized protein (TIGR02646 family)
VKPFRNTHPERTCKVKRRSYRLYKDSLRNDFLRACGYCDDTDNYCGGRNSFHIDHFKPLKHFTGLECEYSNLVYSCSYCNISKSDDWPCLGTNLTCNNEEGYIDPCDPDFINHFERYDDGRIRPKTTVGKYMFEQLKLGLRRHELIWLLRQLQEKIKEVAALYKNHNHSAKANELLKKHFELTEEFFKYKELYEENI